MSGGLSALQPLVGASAKGDMADPDEVTQVVMNRTGSILSASTILKSDFFSNLQKMTLPESVPLCCLSIDVPLIGYYCDPRRIEGSPNFRRVPLTLRPVSTKGTDAMDFIVEDSAEGKMVCGRYGLVCPI